MGKGIDAVRSEAPVHAALLGDFKDQFIIVALKRLQRLGDDLVFPVSEVDDTSQDMLAFRIDEQKNFVFVLSKKS